MVNIIQPITVQQAYDGITHARRWASWNWWWRMVDDDDSDEFPSLDPRTDSRSALQRDIRAWRWLRVVKWDKTFSLFFSPWTWIYGVGVEVGGGPGGPWDRRPRPRGACPLSRGQAVGPLALIPSPKILINSKKCLRGFQRHSENFSFLHIKQHHGSSAKNSVSPG